MQVDQGAATSCARWRPPGPPGCPRSAGSSRCRGPTPTTTGSFPNAPSCTAPPPSGWPGAAALELAGVGIDDLGVRSTSTRASRRGADGGGRARPARRRPRPAADPDRRADLRRRARATTTPRTASPARSGAAGRRPGSAALVSGLGWYATKHSLGRLRVAPPAEHGGRAFAWRNVQPDVDALPALRRRRRRRPARTRRDLHRHLRPRGSARARHRGLPDADGAGPGATSTDPDKLALAVHEEGIGRTGVLAAEGALTLDG